MNDITKLEEFIRNSKFTVVVTGAGISNSSGIKDMEHMNFIEVAQTALECLVKLQPERSYKILENTFLRAMFKTGPTLTHYKLAELEQKSFIKGIITTNIDCLHSLAGSQNVAEIQGSYAINQCVKCKKEFNDVQIWNHGKAPRCDVCNGIVVSFPVYSSIGLHAKNYQLAIDLMRKANLVIVIGAKGSYGSYFEFMNKNAKLIQINPKSTQFDLLSVLNIKEESDLVFNKLHIV